MKHFRSIDGLRAWLAWTVVLSHIGLNTGADERLPGLQLIDGNYSVRLFIIISGFVITHLLIEKREKYLPYITRRFLRIYPVYLICLCFGIAATYLHMQAFEAHPWGDIVPQPDLLSLERGSLDHGDFLRHLVAHLTMLHGAISGRVLPVSEYMFLGPAWSLSLEWQFYLVAPWLLGALQSRTGRIVVALVTCTAFGAYRQGWLGLFFDPSFLPGAGLYFALGIASRVLFGKLPEFKCYPLATMITAAGFCLLAHDLTPFLLWAAFIAWLRTAPSTHPVSRMFDAAFNSNVARYLGTRSYSVYLIHEPIIHTIVFCCIRQFSLGLWPTVLITMILTVSLTLAASSILYRFVEEPAIAFGKHLFGEFA